MKNTKLKIIIGVVLLSLAGSAVAIKLSLDSPASFPVDI